METIAPPNPEQITTGTTNVVNPFDGASSNTTQTTTQQNTTNNNQQIQPNSTPQPDVNIPAFSIPQQPQINTTNNNNQQNKYKIQDLFWFINPKLYTQQPVENGEAHIVNLSFNIQYGNLRISYYQWQQNAIQGHCVFLKSLLRTISGSIYPTDVFRILHSSQPFNCVEQLFENTGETWQINRPLVQVVPSPDSITIKCSDSNGSHFYTFGGWQKDLLLHTCNWVLDKGLTLSSTLKIG